MGREGRDEGLMKNIFLARIRCTAEREPLGNVVREFTALIVSAETFHKLVSSRAAPRNVSLCAREKEFLCYCFLRRQE